MTDYNKKYNRYGMDSSLNKVIYLNGKDKDEFI